MGSVCQPGQPSPHLHPGSGWRLQPGVEGFARPGVKWAPLRQVSSSLPPLSLLGTGLPPSQAGAFDRGLAPPSLAGRGRGVPVPPP